MKIVCQAGGKIAFGAAAGLSAWGWSFPFSSCGFGVGRSVGGCWAGVFAYQSASSFNAQVLYVVKLLLFLMARSAAVVLYLYRSLYPTQASSRERAKQKCCGWEYREKERASAEQSIYLLHAYRRRRRALLLISQSVEKGAADILCYYLMDWPMNCSARGQFVTESESSSSIARCSECIANKCWQNRTLGKVPQSSTQN